MDEAAALPAPRARARTRLLLAAVVALAAAFRLAAYLEARDGSILYFHRAADTDMNFFDGWAREIAAGDLMAAPRPYHPWHDRVAREVYALTAPGQPYDEATGRRMWDHWLGARTFYQDPLYAFLLAGLYRLFGPGLPPVLAAQAALGLLCVLLTFVVARLLWDDTVGLVAAALVAVYAPLVFYELMLLRGALQAFLVLSAVAAAILAQRTGRPRWWLVTGLCGGLAVLCHAVTLPLALVLCASPLWTSAGRARRAALKVAAAGLLLALSPLVARNLALGLPPWRSGAGQGYGAHNIVSSHAVDADPRDGFPFSAYEGRIFAATDARLLPTLRASLATHPSAWSWLSLMGGKLLAFFDGWENADNVNFYYFLLQAPVARLGLRFAALLPLAALGFVLSERQRAAPPALAVAGLFVSSLVFFTASRVRLSAALCLAPFAAAGLVEAWRRLRAGRARTLARPALAGALAFLVALAPWWPRPQLVRALDFRAGNTLGLARADFERARGRPQEARRILEAQLATEPPVLRDLDPAPGPLLLPDWAAQVAGSFADLHRAAVAEELAAGRPAAALGHAEHARLLWALARSAEAGS